MNNVESQKLLPVAWSYPVQVTRRVGPPEYVENSSQALDCLLHRWPAHTGIYFEMARAKCDRAISRSISGEDARDSFISAAIDAHILGY
jgi:hypothetical protein